MEREPRFLPDLGRNFLGRADRNGGFRHDDQLPRHVLADLARDSENVLKIGGAVFIRRSADGDEQNVGRRNRRADVGRETQASVLLVALDEILETRLVDRKNVLLQAFDLRLDHVGADDIVAGLRQACAHDESNVAGADN